MMRLVTDKGLWAEVFPRSEILPLSRACRLRPPAGWQEWSSWQFCLNHISLKARLYSLHLAGPAVLPVCYERLVEEPRNWLERIMTRSFGDVYALAGRHKVNTRVAAYMLSVDRVAAMHRLRGMYA